MARHKVAALADLNEGEGLCVEVEGQAIALFRAGDEVLAIDNVCPHRGGPLADGFVAGTALVCPWHGWQFDGRTGACNVNEHMSVRCYPVTVEGADVFLEA